MRIKSKSRNHFHATHKGAEIHIERKTRSEPFYIIVTHADGGYLYNGYAPHMITSIKDAKREAVHGAMLNVKSCFQA